MELGTSAHFDPNTDDQSFWGQFPTRPAVFALFLKQASGAGSPPYLSRTSDLRRRLMRLLGRTRPGPVSAENREKGPSAPSTGVARARLQLRQVTHGIAYQCVGSSFEARWLLYNLNKSYYPQAYRQRLRLRPPALLKINLKNRFPRCYPTRKLSGQGSLYYGPFASRVAAERFSAEFLDLFTIRRCVEDLNPDPAHPGCMYSQMRRCLAPCFKGCTDQEYQQELERVVAFMDSEGQSLVRLLEVSRLQASERLEFEEAAKIHRKLEKVQEVLRLRPILARNLADLHALILQRGPEPKSVAFFRMIAGELSGPATLSLDERVASPVSLDQRIRSLLDSLLPRDAGGQHAGALHPDARARRTQTKLPPWEHLSILARWYYSSFREGEIVMLPPSQDVPHARIIRLCRKLAALPEAAGPD